METIIFLVVVLQNRELESLEMKIVYFMIKILFFESNNIQSATLFKIH